MLPPVIVRHRIPNSDKYKDNKKWAKDFINKVIPSFTKNSAYTQHYSEMLSNYRLYNNILDQKEFEKICNYYGVDVNQYQDEILPYNKTYSKINVLCGEELKRGDDFKAYLVTEGGMRKKDEQYKEFIKKYIDAEIEIILQKMQLESQNLPQDEINRIIEEKRANITPRDLNVKNFKSDLEIFVNHVLNFALYDQKIKHRKNRGFKHLLLSDLEMVYVGIEGGKPVIKELNSLNTFFHKGPEKQNIQEGADWAGQRFVMTREDVIDTWGNVMDEDDLDKFEKRYFPRMVGSQLTNKIDPQFENTMKYRELHSLGAQGQIYDGIGSSTMDKAYTQHFDFVEVVTCEFISQREVGFYTYYDEYGNENEKIVSEEFKVPKDAQKVTYYNEVGDECTKWEWTENEKYNSVEFKWIPRVWEGTRIDGDIWVNLREKPIQPLKAKLSYHGIVGHDLNAKSLSVMSRMKPFQFIYFVAMHQLNQLIAKNIGPVTIYDLAQLPDFKDPVGRDNIELVLFYLTKGLAFTNSMQNTQGGVMPGSRGAGVDTMNLSSTNDILNLSGVLEFIDRQIGLAAGISPERESQFSANSNVTDNQQAITQSMHITETLFHIHNEFWKDVLGTYVEYFRLWMKNFFEAHPDKLEHMLNYILPDGTVQTFKVTPELLEMSEMGIFIGNSGQAEAYRQQMLSMLQPMIQNQMQGAEMMSEILKGVISGHSPEDIHRKIKIMSEETNKQMQAAEENKKQMEREALDAQRQNLQMQAEIQTQINTAKEIERRVTELLKIEANKENSKISDDKWVNVEFEKLKQNTAQVEKEFKLKEKELAVKAELEEKKIKASKTKNSTK